MEKRRKQSQPTLASPHLPFDLVTLASPHLPFDLVVEILCRLSVKHLVQLRYVCKSWNSLISGDSNFAKKQLRSTSSHKRNHLILSSPEFLLLHSPISSIFTSPITTVKQFWYSIRSILNKGEYGNRASTCDGIICFKIHNSSAMLCNPFIRKFKILPPLEFPGQLFTLYTLVYHRFTDTYKIIAVNHLSRKLAAFNHLSSKIEVHVHTLGTNYWKRIQDFPGPNLIPRPRSGTFVNDSVNWLTYDYACHAFFIVSLDLGKESYQKLSLPLPPSVFRTSIIALGTLRGCLSLFSRRVKFCDVWVMKEYGNEKSWIKLLSVPHMSHPKPSGVRYTNVLYISEDDQVLMEFLTEDVEFNLVVYDSINNTFKIPKFQNNIHGEMVTQEIYVESLISPLKML